MSAGIRGFLLLVVAILLAPTIAGAGPLLFQGRILDAGGQPVSGAEVYVFNSANVKRPADFISEKSGGDGRYQLVLPPGHYWTMAVQRQGTARVGPLGPNDRFSGEPLAFEGGSDKHLDHDFTVISLKEAALRSHKRNEDLLKVTGRILDPAGLPVAGAYALADPSQQTELPLYLSTWTEADGVYTLYLPKGKIFLGAAKVFPLASAYHFEREAEFDADVVGADLVVPPGASPVVPPVTEER
ncbi:MAG: carboxypeptidase regulatory-like domain-containing protein [Desulfobulbaceae bacterium]|nr:carboxypeptidase regulatory-like domain-containing protein [Desulfobulbaceae bacterium]